MNTQDYEKLLSLYGRLLWKISASIIGPKGCREDVEDIIADVFLELVEHPEHYDENRGNIRTWLCMRTRAISLDWLRKACRQNLSMDDENSGFSEADLISEAAAGAGGSQDVIELLQIKETTQKVIDFITAKDSPMREILMLRFYYEMKPQDIALRLGLEVKTVYDQIREGKRQIRKAFGEDLDE